MIRPFLIALQFLTRLPVRLAGELEAEDLGRSLLYYPLVGLILGGLLAASAWLLVVLPRSWPAPWSWPCGWPSLALSTWTAWPIPSTPGPAAAATPSAPWPS